VRWLVFLPLILSCRAPRALPSDGPACVSPPAAPAAPRATVSPPASIAPAAMIAPAAPAPPIGVDAKFWKELAPGIIAQVERGDWDAFLPVEGTTSRSGARVNLADHGPSLTNASWTRACTAKQLEDGQSYLLRALAEDLRRTDKRAAEEGFMCAKDTCTVYFGEMSFNGSLVFARAGDAVKLVSVGDHEIAVSEDTQRGIDRQDRALRRPPPCRRRSPR
jgi:hypothetical protein